MLPGLSGSLLSHYFAEHLLAVTFQGRLGEATLQSAHRAFSQWWHDEGALLGPASSARAIRDRAGARLAAMLGFETPAQEIIGPGVVMIAGLWTEDLDQLWRRAVRAALAAANNDVRWCLCTNGRELRLIDAQRTYSRAYAEFDLPQALADPRTFAVLWGVLRADAFQRTSDRAPLILDIIETSARHGAAVGRSLRFGVIDAVGRLLGGLLAATSHKLSRTLDAQLAAGFDESLTLVY